MKEELLKTVAEAIIEGDADKAQSAARNCLESGIDPIDIIQEGGGVGLEKVGHLFDELELFLPDLMASGDAMKAMVDMLKPQLKSGDIEEKGKVIFGTVAGDVHDIGKNLCINQLQLHGYTVEDLGIDVASGDFIRTAAEQGANIIAASALMSTSAYYQRDIIEELEKKGLRKSYTVIVGGGPVTREWADEIDADGYGESAVACVEVCDQLMKKKSGGE